MHWGGKEKPSPPDPLSLCAGEGEIPQVELLIAVRMAGRVRMQEQTPGMIMRW